MCIIDRLFEKKEWLDFFEYKLERDSESKKELEDLKSFIDNEEYFPVVESIKKQLPLSPPQKLLISKSSSTKKRIVYSFGREEGYVLKLISFMLKEYDSIFSPNLFSFRSNSGVKNAIDRILNTRGINQYYSYKVDISSYFNSADVDIIIPELRDVFENDDALFFFFEQLLKDTRAEYDGKIINEFKGILPGVPVSNFLANLYLRDLDYYFFDNRILYARYSDDIIVFAKNEQQLTEYVSIIKEFLERRKLTINHSKEKISAPLQPWEFLGFSYCNGKIDVCDNSVEKMKAKMRRKTRALSRWVSRKKLPKEKAAVAFIKNFNAKLYDNPIHNELTWTRWYFPVINTTEGLKALDSYMQECIRYLATGKRTNSKYTFSYQEIKALGYRNLVHEYYEFKKNKANET